MTEEILKQENEQLQRKAGIQEMSESCLVNELDRLEDKVDKDSTDEEIIAVIKDRLVNIDEKPHRRKYFINPEGFRCSRTTGLPFLVPVPFLLLFHYQAKYQIHSRFLHLNYFQVILNESVADDKLLYLFG